MIQDWTKARSGVKDAFQNSEARSGSNRGFRNFKKMERPYVQTGRKKQGPEEALQFFQKRFRTGNCSHCGETGHFYKECAAFWTEVNESRKKASESEI